jgi:calcium-binding protein CML
VQVIERGREVVCVRVVEWFVGGVVMESGPRPQLDLNLAPELVQELADSFKFFDRDGDGRISTGELGAVVRWLGQKVSDADLGKLMREVDTNGDGFIDLAEFMDLNTRAMAADCSGNTMPEVHSSELLPAQSAGSVDAMMSAFNVFDVDKNGFISAEELHFVLAGFGDENVSVDDCRCMIQCVDEDGDQMVNFREFEALMNGSFVF